MRLVSRHLFIVARAAARLFIRIRIAILNCLSRVPLHLFLRFLPAILSMALQYFQSDVHCPYVFEHALVVRSRKLLNLNRTDYPVY